MLTESQQRAQAKYLKKMKNYSLRLNTEKDVDLIEWLDSKPEVKAYLVQLIREDMERNVQGNVQ
jgi:hypothetical protein